MYKVIITLFLCLSLPANNIENANISISKNIDTLETKDANISFSSIKINSLKNDNSINLFKSDNGNLFSNKLSIFSSSLKNLCGFALENGDIKDNKIDLSFNQNSNKIIAIDLGKGNVINNRFNIIFDKNSNTTLAKVKNGNIISNTAINNNTNDMDLEFFNTKDGNISSNDVRLLSINNSKTTIFNTANGDIIENLIILSGGDALRNQANLADFYGFISNNGYVAKNRINLSNAKYLNVKMFNSKDSNTTDNTTYLSGVFDSKISLFNNSYGNTMSNRITLSHISNSNVTLFNTSNENIISNNLHLSSMKDNDITFFDTNGGEILDNNIIFSMGENNKNINIAKSDTANIARNNIDISLTTLEKADGFYSKKGILSQNSIEFFTLNIMNDFTAFKTDHSNILNNNLTFSSLNVSKNLNFIASKDGNISHNTIAMQSVAVKNSINAAVSENGNIIDNNISNNNAVVNGDINLANSMNGDVISNRLSLINAKIDGSIYGANSKNGKVENNEIYINNATINGDIIATESANAGQNNITIDGFIDAKGSIIGDKNSTIKIQSTEIKAKEIVNFKTMDFILNENNKPNSVIVNLTQKDAIDLRGVDFHLSIQPYDLKEFYINNQITLIKSKGEILTDNNISDIKHITFKENGTDILYEFKIESKKNAVIAKMIKGSKKTDRRRRKFRFY